MTRNKTCQIYTELINSIGKGQQISSDDYNFLMGNLSLLTNEERLEYQIKVMEYLVSIIGVEMDCPLSLIDDPLKPPHLGDSIEWYIGLPRNPQKLGDLLGMELKSWGKATQLSIFTFTAEKELNKRLDSSNINNLLCGEGAINGDCTKEVCLLPEIHVIKRNEGVKYNELNRLKRLKYSVNSDSILIWELFRENQWEHFGEKSLLDHIKKYNDGLLLTIFDGQRSDRKFIIKEVYWINFTPHTIIDLIKSGKVNYELRYKKDKDKAKKKGVPWNKNIGYRSPGWGMRISSSWVKKNLMKDNFRLKLVESESGIVLDPEQKKRISDQLQNQDYRITNSSHDIDQKSLDEFYLDNSSDSKIIQKKKSMKNEIDAEGRVRVIELDYRSHDTQYFTHRFHSYPAIMIGPVANYCLKEWLSDANIIIDPYVGSGSVLVEASLLGKKSYGIDLNPLAVLLSRVKTRAFDFQEIASISQQINNQITDIKFNPELKSNYPLTIPSNITNWEYWYKKSCLHDLIIVKNIIEETTSNQNLRDYFYVVLSEIVRKASYQRNGEFKRYRLKEEKLKKFHYDVFSNFLEKVKYNNIGYSDYLKARNKIDPTIRDPIVKQQDSRHLDWLENESIDGLLTSPPYGDSGTTVAYGQYSRFSLEFFDFSDEIKSGALDNHLLGGKKSESPISVDEIHSKTLDATLAKIYSIDDKRGAEVEKFFVEYYQGIREFSRILKRDSTSVFVVGNRTVKGIWIETDQITSEMFDDFGFNLKGIYIRDIPNKRMPSRNSPTNIRGEKVTTMVNEYIVVMKRG